MMKKAVFILAFFSLFYKLLIVSHSMLTFYSDDAIYAELARFWIQGKWNLVFHPTWQPLYPFISAIVFFITKKWELSLQLVSVFSSALLVFPLYLLARNFMEKFLAFILCLTFLFLTPVINISLFPMSDMLSTFLILSAITFSIFAIQSDKLSDFVVPAILFGFAYLTRSEGFIFFVLTLGYLSAIFLASKISRRRSKIKLKMLLIPSAIFFLTIGPYWLTMHKNLDTWNLSFKASAQIKQGHAFQLNPNGSTWSQEVVSVKYPNYKSEYFTGGLSHVLEFSDWYWFWFLQKTKAWENVFINIFPIWSMPIMGVGVLFGLQKKYRNATLYILLIMCTIIPLTVFGTAISDIRYLLWSIPLFLLYFLLGSNVIIKSITKNKVAAVVVTIFLVLTFPSFDIRNITSPYTYAKSFSETHYRPEIKEAGLWLLENAGVNTKILMRHEGVEFYGDAQTIYTPQDLSYQNTIAYAKANKTNYIVAWQEELVQDKHLFMLLDPHFSSNELEKVFQYPKDNPRIIIYEIQ